MSSNTNLFKVNPAYRAADSSPTEVPQTPLRGRVVGFKSVDD
jgi:hypothetical protein